MLCWDQPLAALQVLTSLTVIAQRLGASTRLNTPGGGDTGVTGIEDPDPDPEPGPGEGAGCGSG